MTIVRGRADDTVQASPRATVFAPALGVTVTIEGGNGNGEPEIHLHAGGQGYWIARLMAELGARVTLVGTVGGEVGPVLGSLVDRPGIDFKPVAVGSTSGAYVHDRRCGTRHVIAEMRPQPFSRHDADELYGAALVAALDADVCVLAGPGVCPVVEPDVYRRLTADVRANGTEVVADVSGPFVEAVLEGGVSILKTSEEELERDGWLPSPSADATVACARALLARGAGMVAVTRAEAGAVVASPDGILTVAPPPFQEVEPRGAGDSFTGGLAVGIARALPLPEAIGLGAAAGALNVTRRGLGSGKRDDIEALARRIHVTDPGDEACVC